MNYTRTHPSLFNTRVSILALVVASFSCEKPDPTLQMIDALGGHAAIDSLTSLAVDAECIGPSGPFRTEVQSLRPDRVFFRQTSQRDTTAIWSTSDSTWMQDGARVRTVDARVRSFVRGHEFHMLLFEVESRFSNRTNVGQETVDGHECALVTMTDEAGNVAALLIDRESHLPRVLELSPPEAQGPIHIYFDDWRRVEGLMFFYSFRLTEGPDRTFTYRYTTISPNTVDAALFERLN